MSDFFTNLKNELQEYNGDLIEVQFLPEYFKILSDLLSRKISTQTRKNICSALAYLIAPKDTVPEEIYGSNGYIDDLFICTYVLHKAKESHGLDIIEDLWYNEEVDFSETLKQALLKSSKFVDSKNLRSTIFEYVAMEP